MYRCIDYHVNSMLLNITIPPGPESTPTTTNVTERGTIMKIISINEEKKGKERSNINCIIIKRSLIIILFNTEIQVQVSKRITLAQLKEALVPLIGVPPTGFIVYAIKYYGEYELEGLDKALEYMYIDSGSKV